jgi:hypothetical protein
MRSQTTTTPKLAKKGGTNIIKTMEQILKQPLASLSEHLEKITANSQMIMMLRRS